MNQNDFIEEVKEFQSLYCGDFLRKHRVTFDFDDEYCPLAEIKCEDFGGYEWNIPIRLGHDGEIGIVDEETLTLDGEGLYCYLWHEAMSRLV